MYPCLAAQTLVVNFLLSSLLDFVFLRYQEDFSPLVSGCSCYCCKSHTRAYIHHLLVTNELLAGVLLMMHNFEHYFRFFCSIREALKSDTLAQLKELIRRQMS